jgi:hypothetical protein
MAKQIKTEQSPHHSGLPRFSGMALPPVAPWPVSARAWP